jgi:hypothetical protein
MSARRRKFENEPREEAGANVGVDFPPTGLAIGGNDSTRLQKSNKSGPSFIAPF